MRLTKIKGINNKPRVAKASRVLGFSVPKLGRIAITRDPGEASLFSSSFIRTNLSGRLLDPKGRQIEAFDWGSGLVTNVGVLALAQDLKLSAEAKAKEPFNLVSFLKFHAWSKSAAAPEQFDTKLPELQKPNETEATELPTREVTSSGVGKPKIVLKGKIKAESETEIKSWGLFTQKTLSATTGTPLVSVTATEGKVTATPYTASTTEIKGERLKILEAEKNAAKEAKAVWGLITSNSTSVVTVPAWYKQNTGSTEEPEGTSAFVLRPVMFDHKSFTTVGVTTGNEIEFIYELEFPAGG